VSDERLMERENVIWLGKTAGLNKENDIPGKI
jgi:hypothetical protein